MNCNICSKDIQLLGTKHSGLFGIITEVCERLNTNFFVVGALTRDILMCNVYGVCMVRATKDVDIAMVVEDWAAYEGKNMAVIICIEMLKNHVLKVGDYQQKRNGTNF